jgi:chorismate synthase
MGNNTLGRYFTVTSFGESHGAAIGCVIDGVPANVQIDLAGVQAAVDARKTSSANFSSKRLEADQVQILSGLYEGKTLGSPITILIQNTNVQSADYDNIKEAYRPNHADYTNAVKYGIRDYRGGGRSSIRITAAMVAAGAIAYQIIQAQQNVSIISYVENIGGLTNSVSFSNEISQESILQHPLRMLANNDAINEKIDAAVAEGDTLGGIITTHITGFAAGYGEPIFNKLQAALAHAMLSINTVKGFEYGDGFSAAQQIGSTHNDEFVQNETQQIVTKTNHSGGIQGGISNGMPIYFRTAFKPISSIKKTQQTINEKGNNIAITIAGRHDVCAVPRAVPIVNAYTAIVLLDFILAKKLN